MRPRGSRVGRRREPQLRECPGCGLFQTVPALAPGMTAQCARCPTILRRTSAHRLDHIIALTVTAFVLLVVMCSTTLMSVETAGIIACRRPVLRTGGAGSAEHGRARGGGRVRHRAGAVRPADRHALRADPIARKRRRRAICAGSSRSAEKLRPWSMIDVFVFGVFVAYVKLGDLVTIGLAAGVYALLALTFVLVWMDSALDRETVWERLDRGQPTGWRRVTARRAQSVARPAAWSAYRGRMTRAARAATAPCTRASRTASRGPGPWSSPPRSFTSRRTITRC